MKDTYPNKVGLAPAATAGSGNAPALIFNELMNLLIKILVRLGLLKRNLDYHLVRASMVIIYFFFGYQKWFPYEAQNLIPFFKNGPLISWMYPVFGVQGASWFLGVSEWLFGALLFLGFWNKKFGVLGALGSCVTFIMTITIIPFMPDGWNVAAGGFPAMQGNVAFLMKDLVLFAVSVYLLKQDVARASLSPESARAYSDHKNKTPHKAVWKTLLPPQFVLQARKQHYRIMKTQPISFLSGLIVAIAVPVILNAASLSWNPSKIAKDNGIVVLAEETAKPAPKARMNVDSNGVILKGYDPVAYFTRHQAVKGNPAIQTRFGGAIYYFVSVADKVAFNKNPSRYVPQYGGFCAYHLSKGKLKDGDPAAFLIYKGKLYVCSAADSAKEFRSNIDENIRKADDYWLPPGRAQGQPYNRYGPR